MSLHSPRGAWYPGAASSLNAVARLGLAMTVAAVTGETATAQDTGEISIAPDEICNEAVQPPFELSWEEVAPGVPSTVLQIVPAAGGNLRVSARLRSGNAQYEWQVKDVVYADAGVALLVPVEVPTAALIVGVHDVGANQLLVAVDGVADDGSTAIRKSAPWIGIEYRDGIESAPTALTRTDLGEGVIDVTAGAVSTGGVPLNLVEDPMTIPQEVQ